MPAGLSTKNYILGQPLLRRKVTKSEREREPCYAGCLVMNATKVFAPCIQFLYACKVTSPTNKRYKNETNKDF